MFAQSELMATWSIVFAPRCRTLRPNESGSPTSSSVGPSAAADKALDASGFNGVVGTSYESRGVRAVPALGAASQIDWEAANTRSAVRMIDRMRSSLIVFVAAL